MRRVVARRKRKAPAPIDASAIAAGISDAAKVVEMREEALQAPVLPGLDLPEEPPVPQPDPDRAL